MTWLLAVLVVGMSSARASSSFFDSFEGASIDTSKWQVSLPFDDSSAAVTEGMFTTLNRGTIFSQSSFIGPYRLQGAFINNDPTSSFSIVLRSDGTFADWPTKMPRGFIITYFAPNARPEMNVGTKAVIEITVNDTLNVLWASNRTYSANIPITFDIYDSGDSIAFFTDGVFGGEFNTSNLWGSKIGFASRDNILTNGFGSGNASLLEMHLTQIPEPSSLSLLLAGGLVALARRRRCL